MKDPIRTPSTMCRFQELETHETTDAKPVLQNRRLLQLKTIGDLLLFEMKTHFLFSSFREKDLARACTFFHDRVLHHSFNLLSVIK